MKSWMLVLLTVLMTSGLSVSIGILVFRQVRKSRIGRRSPLSGLLLRSPGQSLLPQIEELRDEIDTYVMGLFTVPPMIFGLYMGELYFEILKPTWLNIALNIAMVLAVLIYCARRMSHFIDRRHKLQLGYDAELAVGQELNHLMLQGCRVYHDFPAEEFNIDHIVIGPGGVIAVETKGCAKRDQGGGSAEAKVIFNGEYLRFPHWRNKKFVMQARRQAEWLQKWLTSAVGQTVKVRPALALAGWYVERTKPADVLVFNGKSPIFLSNPKITGDALSAEMIRRIAHQLEQRCRDVEPVAYRKEKLKK